DDRRQPCAEERWEREERAAAGERVTDAGHEARRDEQERRIRPDSWVAFHRARKDTATGVVSGADSETGSCYRLGPLSQRSLGGASFARWFVLQCKCALAGFPAVVGER